MTYRQQQKELIALRYVEKYGIIDYQIKGKWLIYYANYPAYLSEPRKTYKVMYDLNTGEETRIRLGKWSSKGNHNMYK